MIEVTENDVQKANEAFDIAFSADPEGIDKVMTALFATHRIEAAKAERDRIVGWLRDQDGYGEWHEAADALEKQP